MVLQHIAQNDEKPTKETQRAPQHMDIMWLHCITNYGQPTIRTWAIHEGAPKYRYTTMGKEKEKCI